MNEVKKGLLQKIAEKVARKKALQAEMADRKNNVAKFALEMLGEMEHMIGTGANPSIVEALAPLYVKSFEERLRVIDAGANISVTWQSSEDEASPSLSRVSGILIKWSKDYQVAHNCDPELYVDIAELLFKD